uniref:ISL LIM homeobox 2 n=1 Tax=Canis lupus familiaris TaxID=9615 RepID=A0A8I3PM82_CANLF
MRGSGSVATRGSGLVAPAGQLQRARRRPWVLRGRSSACLPRGRRLSRAEGLFVRICPDPEGLSAQVLFGGGSQAGWARAGGTPSPLPFVRRGGRRRLRPGWREPGAERGCRPQGREPGPLEEAVGAGAPGAPAGPQSPEQEAGLPRAPASGRQAPSPRGPRRRRPFGVGPGAPAPSPSLAPRALSSPPWGRSVQEAPAAGCRAPRARAAAGDRAGDAELPGVGERPPAEPEPEGGQGAGPGRPARAHLRPVPAEPAAARQPSLRPHVHKPAEKTTRVRTVLNEKQLHTLRTCYAANPRPDALMKEQLVEMTGLSPRVIRVWFQNKRCKDKKKSILMKQLQQQQHNDKTSLQGLTGTPLVAGSPIRHESAVQGSAVEVQTYQPPWKALSEFALQSDLDQPAFQQLVSFSESGSLGNSSGSDVTSLSSQLPDTPNSMVPSPVET